MKKILTFCLLSACTMATLPLAAEASFSSGPSQVALLELYSSEGCSSCPPADRWLSGLLDHEQLFSKIIPIAFQVDYWDYIGWQDPYAKPVNSARQRNYARKGFTSGVYTPGLFVNGREWRGWRRGRDPAVEQTPAGLLNLEKKNGLWHVNYQRQQPVAKRLYAHLAVLGFDLATSVPRGENAGKTLKHDFVVLDWSAVKLVHDEATFNAIEAKYPNKKLAIVAWVSQSDQTPLQATGGWLTP